MKVELQKNVNLTIETSKKFKTTQILIRFTTKLESGLASKRSLLTSLLSASSKKYPVENDISKALANLYGASFYPHVGKKGNLHQLDFIMNCVSDRYLPESGIESVAIDFMQEIIFHPAITNGSFDPEIFALEQQNLINLINSMDEDKEYYASKKIQQLYFQNDPLLSQASQGSVAEIAKLTPTSLAEYYQDFLDHDQVEIVVFGDVDPDQISAKFKMMPFTAREFSPVDLFYQEPQNSAVKEVTETQDLAQAKLLLAYLAPITAIDPQIFALRIFNIILGASSNSKLFMNVREKASLAYYANSSFDSFREFLLISTGIATENYEQVKKLIAEQLQAIINGEITDDELQQAKTKLKNSYIMLGDNQAAQIELIYSQNLLPKAIYEPQQYLQHVDSVTKEQVIEIAKMLKLQTIFFLQGAQ